MTLGLYGKGFHQYMMDEVELGTRVARWLDSENNAPEVHFVGWYLPPYEGRV
jgi:hypothetical protein